MANLVHNRSKGRVTEFAERINANDPANSAFLIRLVAASGVESDAVLTDKDSWSDLVSGTTDFATNTGATTKTIADGAVTVTYNDTNDRTEVDCADQTWTGLANDGTGAVGDVEIGYDSDTTTGTDANVLPCTLHDFSITPDGSDVTAQITDFFRAS